MSAVCENQALLKPDRDCIKTIPRHSSHHTSNMLTLALIFALAGSLPLASASCNSFTSNGAPYNTSDEIVPVSEGVTCNVTQGCWIGTPYIGTKNFSYIDTLVGGIVTVNRTLNYSASSDIVNNLFSTISSATHMTFLSQVTTNVTHEVGLAIAYNESGYASWRPTHTCVVGTLGSCSGDGYPSDGTLVEACTPIILAECGRYPCVPGGFWFENTTQAEAQSVYCQACEEEIRLTSGASAVKATNAAVLLSVVALLAGLVL